MNKKTQKMSPLEAIIENYRETEKSLMAQLNFQVPDHPPTIGGFREEIWKQLFEQIVPKKYVIEQSVFLMDSNENVSDEVDLAIFDEMYTPYIFRNGRIKFIPIEAVAAAVQCKSTNVNNVIKSDSDIGEKYILEKWCKSIENLKTSGNSITRIATGISQGPVKTQNGTRPIKILCALKKPNQDFMKNFDFYIIADKDKSADKIDVIIPHEKDWDLSEWHYELNMRDKLAKSEFEKKKLDRKLADYRIETVALLALNLQLNQLLMLINNPMLFPHMAYVEMFNRVDKENKNDGNDSN